MGGHKKGGEAFSLISSVLQYSILDGLSQSQRHGSPDQVNNVLQEKALALQEQKEKKISHSSFAPSGDTIHINSSHRLKHEWSNAPRGRAMRELLVILILLSLPPAAMSTSHHFDVPKPSTPIRQLAYTPMSEPTNCTDFKTWVLALASLIVVMGFGVRYFHCNVVCCSILADAAGGQAAPTPFSSSITTAQMAAPPTITPGSSDMDPNDQVTIDIAESEWDDESNSSGEMTSLE
ncbi:unnamed protein product [Sphagnum balticum]